MKLYLILIIAVFGYVISSNALMNDKIDKLTSGIERIDIDGALSGVQDRFQRIMNRYGTRLVLVEKGVKKHHGVETLDELTGPRRKD